MTSSCWRPFDSTQKGYTILHIGSFRWEQQRNRSSAGKPGVRYLQDDVYARHSLETTLEECLGRWTIGVSWGTVGPPLLFQGEMDTQYLTKATFRT